MSIYRVAMLFDAKEQKKNIATKEVMNVAILGKFEIIKSCNIYDIWHT